MPVHPTHFPLPRGGRGYMVGMFSETLWLNLMMKIFTRLVKVTDEELIHLMEETDKKKKKKVIRFVKSTKAYFV